MRCFLRSPHAHARIKLASTLAGGQGAPGVLAVFTGETRPRRPSAGCPAAG
jgi:CO/xanthine dehydrogenase Mo-binding subunit